MDLLAWRKSSPSKAKRFPRSFGSSYREGRIFEDCAVGSSGRDSCEGCNTDEELPSGDDLDVTSSDDRAPLTQHKLAVCLALYADALLIVQSVHSARVLHFDIKCNNFILRCEPDLDTMYRCDTSHSISLALALTLLNIEISLILLSLIYPHALSYLIMPILVATLACSHSYPHSPLLPYFRPTSSFSSFTPFPSHLGPMRRVTLPVTYS